MRAVVGPEGADLQGQGACGGVGACRTWRRRPAGSVFQAVDGGGADAEVAEDLCPVFEGADHKVVIVFAVNFGGHHHGVAGHDGGVVESAEQARATARQDGAVSAQHKGFARFGVFVQACGFDDVGHGFAGLVDEHVFIDDAARGGDKRGHAGHHEAVAVFKGQCRDAGLKVLQALRIGLSPHAAGKLGRVHFEGDSALAAHVFEAFNLPPHLFLLLFLQGFGLGGAFTGQVGSQRCTGGLQLAFEPANQLVEVFLLLLAHALAGEFGTIHIGLRREPTHASKELGQGFTREGLVKPRGCNFAFDAHQTRAALGGQLQVGAAHDGDHVTRLQGQVVGRVFLHDGFAQVERNEFRTQFVGVQAFDDGVVPVDLVDDAAHALLQVGTGFLAVLDFILSAEDLHQRVFTLVVTGGDEGFAVGNEVLHAHAGHPAVAQGLGHGALQCDGVGKGGADGQEGEDVTVLQRLGQALGGDFKIQHFSLGAARAGRDAFEERFLGAGEFGNTAAQGEHVLHGAAGLEFVDGAVVGGAGQGHAGACGGDHDDVAGLQGGVFGFVALGNEVIQIEGGDGFAAALELDGAHAAVHAGATAGKHGVDQGGQAAQVVGAGLARLADHINRDAAQLAQAGVDSDVGEDGGHAAAQGGFEVFDLHAVELDGADFGQADLAVAVECLAAAVVGAAPDLDAHLVTGAEHVFAGCGGGGVNGVGLGVVKQGAAKLGQKLAGAGLHKALELAGRLGFERLEVGRLGVLQFAEQAALGIFCAKVRGVAELGGADTRRDGAGCAQTQGGCATAPLCGLQSGRHFRGNLGHGPLCKQAHTRQKKGGECVSDGVQGDWGHRCVGVCVRQATAVSERLLASETRGMWMHRKRLTRYRASLRFYGQQMLIERFSLLIVILLIREMVGFYQFNQVKARLQL